MTRDGFARHDKMLISCCNRAVNNDSTHIDILDEIGEARGYDSIELMIDSYGGCVDVKGLAKYPSDTIRIKKWKVYNYEDDSVVTYSSAWRFRGDTLGRLLKHDFYTVVNHPRSKDLPPPVITVNVNGKDFDVPLHRELVQWVNIACGKHQIRDTKNTLTISVAAKRQGITG